MRKLMTTLVAAATTSMATVLPAFAEAVQHANPHHKAGSSFMSMLPMLIIFVALFYFLLVRPQQKRAKEQKQLMNKLTNGDEVITTAGIIGKIKAIRDNYVTVEICKDVAITLQKQAIASTLPKGTMDSVH